MKLKELSVLIGVIFIVIMLIIPLPTGLIDFLIILNISLSLIIILVAMSTKDSLQFSIFPTLLLLVTLFRIGLSVSTIRSILSKADAGNVIDTFGNYVVGGNTLVGFVVFMVLVLIQFIVITKGAERVSEVGARFTLDAMPGKQMSIDADLNAGLISDQEAKARRERIEKEADFYGAMDGASKFVKGDAIASIVIVFISMIFGLIIGMMQMGMDLGTAAQTYTVLTIGDGLVTQIPALLISTATGIIVTRAASSGSLGDDITSQLFAYPKMLYVAAITIFLLGVITPIDKFITFTVAAMIAGGAFQLTRIEKKTLHEETAAADEAEPEEDIKSPESVVSLLQIEPIEFEFGYGLIPLADTNQGGDMLDRVVMIRRQLALELGMVVPVIRIRDNIQLQPNEYVIKIKGNEISKGELLLDHYMAMSPGVDDESIVGIETIEPAFGLPAIWISEEMKEQAELSGYTVVDPPSVVSTHLTEIIKRHAFELLGRQETKQLVDHLKESYPALVEEITPNHLSIGEIQKVLKNLLKENISIRNLPVIFETLADYGPMTKDMGLITEYVRQSLSRQITKQMTTPGEPLYVITLSGVVEKKIADAIQQTEHGNFVSMDPNDSQMILQAAAEETERLSQMGQMPVILCSPAVRMYVRQLFERYLPQIPVLSYNELEANVEVQSVGVVNPS
ncbi:flagellar biosynthesis protein FlhA [Alkalihalobacillus alcalophilus ATCC 27647 = CGMCC 1.3604]|uniref:Flagellar biosynthesis protein FlhA n=1 Tax=Alkalihalobacillus alcalophilus ATCC 27647 = CGMCC 1.3604 TaxID=1218173 RepID=A0A094WKJ1_ALKAL|nr:flagellar biosynthesis protein FlhA [Alkalihalobacillus alcalophilus]KGA98234.1 flagellar biosynthesis protein FlhA [Alkalihalobacillus alcalophilus ATCC 27647 = CGMCC 1.3604]MED1562173.1 flagellar biosynthesis protein FlhA [Alkalihalobacillus alcalophilus]THG91398.1 flagellar biosynthesis protein FlhA [Alkalihalobacillus alcalophilus ATCC 27647 = CGMCC 1.3604]